MERPIIHNYNLFGGYDGESLAKYVTDWNAYSNSLTDRIKELEIELLTLKQDDNTERND